MNAIAIIKDEHRSMAAVVKGLQNHLAEAQAGRIEADPHLCQAMFDYIEALPEKLHHPKEDEYLFRFLRQRTREADAILDELESQHSKGGDLLSALRRKLQAFKETGELAPFQRALEAYADFQWDHMRKEEDIVIPLAERHLTDEDWSAIDTAFAANRDRSW